MLGIAKICLLPVKRLWSSSAGIVSGGASGACACVARETVTAPCGWLFGVQVLSGIPTGLQVS